MPAVGLLSGRWFQQWQHLRTASFALACSGNDAMKSSTPCKRECMGGFRSVTAKMPSVSVDQPSCLPRILMCCVASFLLGSCPLAVVSSQARGVGPKWKKKTLSGSQPVRVLPQGRLSSITLAESTEKPRLCAAVGNLQSISAGFRK